MGEHIIPQGYKLVIGRRRTRVVTYENLRIQTTHPIKEDKPKKIKPSIPSDYAAYNYYNRIKQRRDTIRELAYNNFEHVYSILITLTFDTTSQKDFTIIDNAHAAFKTFIQRVNHHYTNFRYLATFNRQRNGNWHYHVLCNFPQSTKNKTIKELWGNGITYITYLETQSEFDTGVRYLISNMAEAANDTKGKHGYLASKNLERNIVLTSYKASDINEFDEAFVRIMENNRKILYSTHNHLGVQGETVNEETGEVANFTIPDQELNPALEQAGYKSWDSTFTYLSSAARFEEKFTDILPATPRPKKFKRAGRKKEKDNPTPPVPE
ncbi:MAG: hypothetical protein J6A94_10405 [Lachnospiraceae bacterium]|nr:hypothetical protein [Lachnospiraceae bacterium]